MLITQKGLTALIDMNAPIEIASLKFRAIPKAIAGQPNLVSISILSDASVKVHLPLFPPSHASGCGSDPLIAPHSYDCQPSQHTYEQQGPQQHHTHTQRQNRNRTQHQNQAELPHARPTHQRHFSSITMPPPMDLLYDSSWSSSSSSGDQMLGLFDPTLPSSFGVGPLVHEPQRDQGLSVPADGTGATSNFMLKGYMGQGVLQPQEQPQSQSQAQEQAQARASSAQNQTKPTFGPHLATYELHLSTNHPEDQDAELVVSV
jgi:hypothetical protein